MHLSEEALSDVLLVRAFEEADEAGEVISERERRDATEDARAELPENEDPTSQELASFLTRRASLLRARHLTSEVSRLPGSGPPLVSSGLVFFALFAIGLVTNWFGASMGSHRQMPVIANPLMFLILWNLATFLVIAIWSLSRKDRSGRLTQRLGEGDWFSRLLSRGTVKQRALARFAKDRARIQGSLYVTRGRRWLHLSAIALILGALGGLYLMGLLVEFEATWESTFLSQETAEQMLRIFFAPASRLTGIEVPYLSSPLQNDSTATAASWIHLYAASVGLYVLLPRAFLAWRDGAESRTLRGSLPLDTSDAYFRHLLAAHQGRGLEVTVVPYSHTPSPTSGDRLLSLLHDVFGSRARIELADSAEYGAEAEEILAADPDRTHRIVLLFGLAQTPETEVHGRLVEELGRLRSEEPTLVLVDGTGYIQRLGGNAAAEGRAEEHRRSWDRVMRDAGCEPLHLELDEAPTGTMIEAATAALEASGAVR